ncbi:MAG: hypothetical protein AAFY83_06660 [Pseudomonadota bacterium]
MRRAFVFGFFFSIGLLGSFEPRVPMAPSLAQSHSAQSYGSGSALVAASPAALWQAMGPGERLIVDRLATDFYERSLRSAQSQQIEQQTARRYRQVTPTQRSAYRDARRSQWAHMNSYQQQALRGAKRPQFIHLSDQQKWPFRTHALNQLSAAGAIAAPAPQNGRNPGQYPSRGHYPGERGI